MNELLNAEMGKEITISVEENPTTGYTWRAILDDQMMALEHKKYTRTGYSIGGGGVARFTFHPLMVGRTTLRLELRREWEVEPIQVRCFEIIIS